MSEIFVASTFFTGLILTLALVVLGARAVLRVKGVARLTLNGGRVIEGELDETLLNLLDQGDVHLPTSCGGVGTCGLCRVKISGGGKNDSVLPIERVTLNDAEIAEGFRLACQMVVRGDFDVTVPLTLLVAKNWQCTVLGTRTLAPLIKEIILALPEGTSHIFPAGCYVIMVAPPFSLPFSDIEIRPEHEADWQRMGLRQLQATSDLEQCRAYSLVNRPGDTDRLILNIRLALPPGTNPDAPPGVVSSYLFGLKEGDMVLASGHYGNFFVQETNREIILIGGGVGMAPLYAHVYDQLKRLNSKRTISYWYGARGLLDLYYADEMEKLALENENFSWHVALSDPALDEKWAGERGFIHDVIYRKYLGSHPDPQNCEYYLCGPPLMIQSVHAMLNRLGVPWENIFHDDFGD